DTAFYTENKDDGERAVVLENGKRFDGRAGSYEYSIADFARYTYFLEADPDGGDQRRRRSAVPSTELIASDALRDKAELGHRLSAPLAILSLAVLAIPLTTLSPRQRGGGRLILAFLAYFAFFNLQRLAENWLQSGVTPEWLGMLWYQLLIVLMIYAVLLPNSFWLRRVLKRSS
ncbi:MAG: LptF/LptG family permease, partial [Thiohalocapsa sp.]